MGERTENSDEEADNYYTRQQSFRFKYLSFNIFQVYRTEIVKRVNPTHISVYFRDIFDQTPSSRESRHMEIFLNELQRHCNEDILERFMNALKKEEYTALFDLINGDDALTSLHDHYLRKIHENTPRLRLKINVKVVAPLLRAKGCINEPDYQKCISKCEKEGCIAGADYLLNVIHRYHKNWHAIFLNTLEENGYKQLIEDCGLSTVDTDNCKKETYICDKSKRNGQVWQPTAEICTQNKKDVAECEAARCDSAPENYPQAASKLTESTYDKLDPSSKWNQVADYTTVDLAYDDCMSLPPPKPHRFKKTPLTESNDDSSGSDVKMRDKSGNSHGERGQLNLRNPSIASRLLNASKHDQFRDYSDALASTVTNHERHVCRWLVDPKTIGRPTYEEEESSHIFLQLQDINGFIMRGKCQCDFLRKPCRDGSYYIWIHEECRVVMLSVRYAQEWRFFKIHKSSDGTSYYLDRHVFKSKRIREVIAFYENNAIPEKLSNGKTITVRMMYPWGSGLKTSSMIIS